MVLIKVKCPDCVSDDIVRAGKTNRGIQVYACRNKDCKRRTFQLEYIYKGSAPGIEEKIIEMSINGSGIRDTARVLKISQNKVIETLKKKRANWTM